MQKVVLVHGYIRTSADMEPMQDILEKLGYDPVLVDLPLTFQPFDYGASILEGILKGIMGDLPEGEKIHLVGHSTGGLVIRGVLADGQIRAKVGRCVLVATPNYGSELADLAARFSDIFVDLFGTLKSIQSEQVKALEPIESLGIEIGAIAGNNSNLALGRLLEGENDGRVTVKSVRINGLKDFIVLPYGHKDIHKQERTVYLVDKFLRTGSFHDLN
ncbi:MAG: alpha/beta fold hydrolase [Bacillota bacterium]|jgi:pimeloyl-ACP methyl ester carboxylesterase